MQYHGGLFFLGRIVKDCPWAHLGIVRTYRLVIRVGEKAQLDGQCHCYLLDLSSFMVNLDFYVLPNSDIAAFDQFAH